MKFVLIHNLLQWSFKFVVAQRHSFILKSSFDQRLSLVILAAVCFTSLLAWPSIHNPIVTFFKFAVALGLIVFFIVLWRKLKFWSFQFAIDDSGLVSRDEWKNKFQLKRLWISPFILIFHLTNDEKKQLVLVWRDMLDDTGYRHLCRLLLKHG